MTPARSLHTLLDETSWIHALARKLVLDPNLAADLAQEACVEALERRPDDDLSLRGWLATVVRRNLAHLRRGESSRSARERTAARAERLASAHEVVERAETHRNVVLAVLALAEPYRSTLLMRFFEQLSYLEIARKTGVTRATVNSRITRGLELLRQRLESAYGGDRRALLLAIAPLAKLPLAGSLAVPFLGVKVMHVTIGLAAATLLATTVSVGFTGATRGAQPAPTPSTSTPEPEPQALLLAEPDRELVAEPQQGREKQEEHTRKAKEAEQRTWKTDLYHTLALAPDVESISVSTRAGNVEIRESQSGQLEIEAQVRADQDVVPAAKLTQVFEDHVEIRDEDGVLEIEDAHRDDGWSVSLVVHLPARLPVAANSASGNVMIRYAGKSVRANTASGDVRIDLATERLDSLAANTASGDVIAQVSSVAKELSANTASGGITLLVLEPAPAGKSRLNTASGDVRILVPGNVVGEFDLETQAGEIEVPPAFGLDVTGEPGRRRARGTVGNGSGQFHARSASGDVRVEIGNTLPQTNER